MEKNISSYNSEKIILIPRNIKFPSFSFGNGIKSSSKLRLFSAGPYQYGEGKKIKVFSIIESNAQDYCLKIKNVLENSTWKILFGSNARNIEVKGFLNDKALESDLSLYSNCLLLIAHDDNLSAVYHDRMKISAKRNNVRLQFIHKKHLESTSDLPLKGVLTQIIAKDGGTPWILDIENDNFLDRSSFIIGVSYSSQYDRLSYGVAHFIDILNMDEKIEIFKGNLRDPEFRGIFLTKKEFFEIIKKGIEWFKERRHENNIETVNIYFYETSPIRNENVEQVKEWINDSSILGLKNFHFNHVHIKSQNFGNPRFYDIDNVGYSPDFTYMVRQNTALILKNNLDAGNFRFRGEIIVSTTGFSVDGNNKPKGTKGTPVPLFCEITSNNESSLDNALFHISYLTQMDWEFLFKNYRSPFIFKYSRLIAAYINLSCKNDNDLQNFPELWDIRDLM